MPMRMTKIPTPLRKAELGRLMFVLGKFCRCNKFDKSIQSIGNQIASCVEKQTATQKLGKGRNPSPKGKERRLIHADSIQRLILVKQTLSLYVQRHCAVLICMFYCVLHISKYISVTDPWVTIDNCTYFFDWNFSRFVTVTWPKVVPYWRMHCTIRRFAMMILSQVKRDELNIGTALPFALVFWCAWNDGSRIKLTKKRMTMNQL